MKKILTYLAALLLSVFGMTGYAQFDDLYADSPDEVYASVDYDYDDYDSYGYDSDTYDEYDEYLDYRAGDYDIDAYRYTNRLDRYRLAYFATRYYGGSYLSGDAYYNDLSWRMATDRRFRNYLDRQMLFGPQYSSLYIRYGNFGNPYNVLWDGFGRNSGYGFNRFGGRGLAGYYGGFGLGGYNAYCPPSSIYNRNRGIYGGRTSSDIRGRIYAPREDNSTIKSRRVRTSTRTYTDRSVRTTDRGSRVTTSDRRRGVNADRNTRTRVRTSPSRNRSNSRISTGRARSTRSTRINTGSSRRGNNRATSTNRRSNTSRSTSRRSVKKNN